MPIRVMIVDSSVFQRMLIKNEIMMDNRFEVVAYASNAKEIEEKMYKIKVDVISLDIDLPHFGGFESIEIIKKTMPTPIVVYSSVTKVGSLEEKRCKDLGVIEFLEKDEQNSQKYLDALYRASKVKMKQIVKLKSKEKIKPKVRENPKIVKREISKDLTNLIVIGVSTGGPQALNKVLAQLPSDLNAGIIIVQHMLSSTFTSSLCQNLNLVTPFHVVESRNGEDVVDGKIILAKGEFQTHLSKRGNHYYTVLDDGPRVTGHKPSADALFYSVADTKLTIPLYVVVLTGIGSDGTLGCKKIREKHKCIVISENEETSIVYGMPKQVHLNGLTDYHLPLTAIVPKLISFINR